MHYAQYRHAKDFSTQYLIWHPISSGKLNEFKSMQCIQLSKQFTHGQTPTTDDHLCMCNECGGAKSWIFQPSRMPLLLYNDYTYMHVLVLGDGFRFSYSHINSIFDPSVTDAMTTHLKALNLSWRNGEVDHSHKLLLWANVQILLCTSLPPSPQNLLTKISFYSMLVAEKHLLFVRFEKQYCSESFSYKHSLFSTMPWWRTKYLPKRNKRHSHLYKSRSFCSCPHDGSYGLKIMIWKPENHFSIHITASLTACSTDWIETDS